MSNARVTRFNVICGNPVNMGTDLEYWRQVKEQTARILEEAIEMNTAAQEEYYQGVIDGWGDVKYTNEYMDDILKGAGVDTKKVFDMIASNNDQKFTTSYTYACDSKEALEHQDVDCYLDSTTYEGTLYYVVRRVHDNKILKLKHHESPDLSIFVPKEFL